MEKSKRKQPFAIIRMIYVLLILGVSFFIVFKTVKETQETNNKVTSRPQINSEQAFKGGMMEDFQIYNIINAPIDGTPIKDFKGFAVEVFGVDQSKLLYIKYTEEEYTSYKNSDGETRYKWKTINQNSDSTEDLSIYNGAYNLGPLESYIPISNVHREEYYNSQYREAKVRGNTRFIIEYITSDDTVSFAASVGNGLCVINPENEVYNMYLNSGAEEFINSVSSSNIFSSILIYVFVFLGGLIALILGIAIIKLIQDKITEAGQ